MDKINNYKKIEIMKEYILITGASSGIGYHMAQILAKEKFNLIIVARNEKKLDSLKEELKDKYNISVEYIATDLSIAGSAKQLYYDLKNEGFKVTGLINNAGVGSYGEFIDLPIDQDLKMIELNISSVVTLTKLFGKDMAIGGKGRIMNVASLLSFLPFPYYSVYSATKSFVLSFTETFAVEMSDSGVQITALCPGPVDTAFNTEEMWKTNAYKANKPMNPELVAQEGIKLFLKGRGKKIVGFNNWFISNLPRVTPDFIMMKIKKQLASQRI